MTWTGSNPVSIGAPTKKSDYDTLWDNALHLYTFLSNANLTNGAVVKGAGTGPLTTGTVSATNLASNSVSQVKMQDNSVGQAELKTSQGSVSYTGSGNTTSDQLSALPGGQYGRYPQSRLTVTGAAGREVTGKAQLFGRTEDSVFNGSFSTNVLFSIISTEGADGWGVYAQQRYDTASGEIHWVFILRDKETKEIRSMYQAPDHPCMGNGGKPWLVPHPWLGYDDVKYEIIVINPSLADVWAIEEKCVVADESLPDKDFLEVFMDEYEVDEESTPDWPGIPITVGLPKFVEVDGEMILADYRFLPAGTIIKPIKKVIQKPDNIICRSMKIRTSQVEPIP